MFEKMRKMLDKIDADYADIRYEIIRESSISFGGKELTEIGSNSTDGFVVRVLKNGGMTAMAFTAEQDIDYVARRILENALLSSRFVDPPVRLARVNAIKDDFFPVLNEDPTEISLDEKLELVRRYNDIPLGHAKIMTTSLRYSDVFRKKYFLSSEGAEISENLITTGIRGEIIAGDGSLIQNVRINVGGSQGLAVLRNREDYFEKRTAIAVDLLSAKPVNGGSYNCIFNSDMTGAFIHEAFGHYSEADMLERLPVMREKMRIGERLGNENLNIIDDPTTAGQLGFYRYDDEGVEARPVQLMKNGILTGRLHSRRTAALFDEPVSGHCVAQDYRFPPVVRMGTIFIQPGKNSLEDLLNMLGEGLYILDAKGGSTTGENFSFGAQYGYLVKGGKPGPMLRDITVAGNMYQTLHNVKAVGDKVRLIEVGGCVKGPIAQTNIRSCNGGPDILIESVIIGGT